MTEHFLNLSTEDMSKQKIVGSMLLKHPDVRHMHDAFEAMILKLEKAESAASLVEQLRPNILLTGETGTGKELVTQSLYRRLLDAEILPEKPKSGISYGAVNCACLESELLEIELFGTTEHAFTDAGNQPGLVAHLAGYKDIDPKRGLLGKPSDTPALLYLDEIGAADLRVQAKLLRLLDNREFTPRGLLGKGYLAHNLIIVSATNELSPFSKGESTNDRFRGDLFHRLGDTFHFHLPPLRERRDEIPEIAMQFYQKYYRLFVDPQVKSPSLPSGVAEILQKASWPGNGRQLHQVIRRSFILWNGENESDYREIVKMELGRHRSDCDSSEFQ
jgi:DNA-binding NtrC family response regulator